MSNYFTRLDRKLTLAKRRRNAKQIIPKTRQKRQNAAPLLIGLQTDSHMPALIAPEDRNRHMYVVGASGSGKSYFLQSLIQQDIDNGEGCCVIDPHGELYDNLVAYCAAKKNLHRRVVLFNPSDYASYVVGFNPLAKLHPAEDVNVKADKFVEIVKRVMMQDEETQPMIESTLRNCLIPLIQGGHTLLEIERFFDFSQNREIMELAAQSERVSILTFWNNYIQMHVREKEFKIAGVQRRIEKFVETIAVRLSIGQKERILNLKEIVEQRKILLVNLGIKGDLISNENARLLGTMLVNNFLSYGFSRDIHTAKARPFYLYMDEFQDFITSDILKILTGGRKFGIHLIMANQELSQIKDDAIRDAVQAARVQVAFGGGSPQAVDLLSRNLGGHHNLLEIKYIEKRPYFEPYLEKRSTQSTSQTEATGSTQGENQSASYGRSQGSSRKQLDFYPTENRQRSEQRSSGSSSSQKYQQSQSTTQNEQWVTSHIKRDLEIEHHYSLDEQRYRLWAQIMTQPQRYAFVQVGKENHYFPIRTLDVKVAQVSASRKQEFKKMVYWSHSCYLPRKSATLRIGAHAGQLKPILQKPAPQRALLPAPQEDPQNPFE